MKEINLIKTKFFIPPVPENTVERKDLISLFDKGLTKKLTYISAPAGYGKTVSVSNWLKINNKKCAWFSIDKYDNNFTVFSRYLINSLRNIDNNIAIDIEEILNQDENPDKYQFLSLLINELSGNKNQYIIVFEDYQNISDLSIHDSVSFLLNNLPDNVHLYLLTRNEIPELPLSKLRAKNMLNEIKAHNLKFSSDCINEFFEINKVKINQTLVKTIEEKTEGWILGIYMLLLSIEGKKQEEIFNYINNAYIKDYLLDEVFNNLSEELKDFLKKTSFLSKFNIELCEYITGLSNSAELLQELEKNNLFIFSIDNKHTWFRYHNLFYEFLNDKFINNSKENKGLILKAAKWFKNKNLILEAISYAFIANEILYAAELIEEVVSEFDARGNINTLAQWFDILPEEIVISREKLYTYYCCYLSQNNKTDKLRNLINNSEKLNNNTNDIMAQNANIKAIFEFINSNLEMAKKYSFDCIEYKVKDLSIISSACHNLGFMFYIENNYQTSLKYLEQSVYYNKQINNYLSIINTEIFRARILSETGRLKESYNLLNEVINYACLNKLSNHHTVALAKAELSIIAYYLNQLTEAEKLINDAINILSNIFKPNIYQLLIKGSIYLTKYELAEKLINRFEELDKLPINILFLKIEMLLQTKSSELIEKVLLKNNIDYQKLKTAETIILSDYYLLKGNYKKALELLENTTETKNKIDLIKLLLLKARILFKTSQVEKAKESINYLFSLDNISEYNNVIIDKSQLIEELILEILKSKEINGLNNYIEVLIYELNKKVLNKNNILSQREIEILVMLNSDLSNPEIAEKLFISLNTLKTHLKNIYRKMEVKNRNQAISKANNLQLF